MEKSILVAVAAALLLVSCAGSPAPSRQEPARAPEKAAPASDTKQEEYNSAAMALIRGDSAAKSDTSQGQKAATPASAAETSTAAAPAVPETEQEPDISAADRKFIQNYLNSLHYMVFFSEKSTLGEFQAKSAVTQADRYLLQQGLDVIDYDQIVKNKEDQKKAFQAEAGEGLDIIQFIAQKLNADVYVELDGAVVGTEKNEKYYGDANITARMYEASTATLLGSVTYKSPTAMSVTSTQDAVTNALVAGVWAMMPRIIDQSKLQMAVRVQKGLKYEVIIQKTPDARLMSQFRRAFQKKLHDLEQISSSTSETRYYAYAYARLQDVEDAVYSAAEKVPGLENIYQVYSRGKSITFNSGIQ